MFGSNTITFAQPFPQLRFQQLTEKDGLSNNNVIRVTQDKQGFIWIATDNGLNRFDGYRFLKFYHVEGDSTSLPGNQIAHLTVDEKGNMWVSTHTGLAYFNTITKKSIPFKHAPGDTATLETDEMPIVYIDTSNSIWATTNKGLYQFDNVLNYHKINGGNKVEGFLNNSKYSDHYTHITQDKKGQLWSYQNNRLYLLDPISKKALQTFIGPQLMTITDIYFDSDDRCWLSTWGAGLYEFIKEKKEFVHVDLGEINTYGSSIIEWTINQKRYIVTGSDRYAFVLLDPKTMAYRIYKKDWFQKYIISARAISPVFVDRQNILWFATENGLSYVTPSSAFFDVIPVYQQSENKYDAGLSSKIVYSFLPDESGNWASTWWAGGVYQYDSNWQIKKYIPAVSLPGKQVTDINKTVMYMRRSGSEIYCTTDSGMFAIDTSNYHVRFFSTPDEKSYADMRNIVSISKNLWWVRTHSHGIYVFDVAQGKFIKHYEHTEGCSNCLPAARLEWIAPAKKGTIYISSEDGLYEYRPATDDFINYKRNEKDSLTFPTNDMDGFALDNAGKIWLGTDKGLCVFNTFTKKVEKTFTENKTMGFVFRVCIDDYQNVWFNSSDGDWCWIKAKDKLIHFNNDEGFPHNTGIGFFINGKDGFVYNGCEDAIVKFYPKKIMDAMKPSAIPIVISEIIANNKEIQYILNTKKEKTIELDPSQNSFTVDFAALNYDKVNSNKYYYRLLPSVKEWRQNDNGHLSFYELPPGNYRLEVKGGNEWTGDFSGIDFLMITIRPHWYQTSWFKLLLILLTLAGIIFFVKRRIMIIRKEASFKQKIATTEMQALRAQMSPHFIFNSLNSIENFMMRNDKEMASEYFHKFASLIRTILESSRTDLVSFSKDIEALQLYVELEQLRFNNKFLYNTHIDPALIHDDFNVPPLLIQPYVENAIIHGLAQSDKNNLILTITASLENDYIIYIIQDNGIGRTKAALYKQQNLAHKSMGLYITQQRINIFNQQQQAASEVIITDLKDENGEACGTKVHLKLKAV